MILKKLWDGSYKCYHYKSKIKDSRKQMQVSCKGDDSSECYAKRYKEEKNLCCPKWTTPAKTTVSPQEKNCEFEESPVSTPSSDQTKL